MADWKAIGTTVVIVDSPGLIKDVKVTTGAKMKLAVDAIASDTAGRLADTLERGGTLAACLISLPLMRLSLTTLLCVVFGWSYGLKKPLKRSGWLSMLT